MIVELEEPYKSKYKYGILRGSLEKDSVITLVIDKNSIDGVTEENYKVGVETKTLNIFNVNPCAHKVICAHCKQHFFINNKELKNNKTRYCSKTCNGKANVTSGKLSACKPPITQDQIDEIKRLKSLNMRLCFIIKQTGLSKNTIKKYWQ